MSLVNEAHMGFKQLRTVQQLNISDFSHLLEKSAEFFPDS